MGSISYRKTGTALAAAVALASGAYTLGSQAEDGTAEAARTSSSAAATAGGPRGADSLASRLGVSEAKLRAALEDLRDDRPAPRDKRADLAAELAKELGVEQAKVEAALERIRERHEAEQEKRRAEFAASLAKKLGISTAKVTEALEDGGFHGPGGHHHRGRGPGGPPPGP